MPELKTEVSKTVTLVVQRIVSDELLYSYPLHRSGMWNWSVFGADIYTPSTLTLPSMSSGRYLRYLTNTCLSLLRYVSHVVGEGYIVVFARSLGSRWAIPGLFSLNGMAATHKVTNNIGIVSTSIANSL
jgi:hypothetical protein